MGLKERKAVKSLEENLFPSLKQEVLDTLGFEIEIEVLWDTLTKTQNVNSYENGFQKVYFLPVIEALKEIGIDDMGKEALKESLKKIVIKDENEIYSYTQWSSFEDGILTLDHQIGVNHDDFKSRKKQLQKMLEDAL